MDEYLQRTGPQFSAGQEEANLLYSCEILKQALDVTNSISVNNVNAYFSRNEYEGVEFVAFPSFYTGDISVLDSPYAECEINNENDKFSDRLKGDDDQPALVHRGVLKIFLQVLQNTDLETQMEKLSKQRKGQPIIFVGQSIGGAVATLATICFLDRRLRNIYPLCITFGSPLVGNAALRESIGYQDWSGRFCHVVSKHDVVPRMLLAPFESIALHLISIFPQRGSIMGIDSVNLKHPSTLEACRKLVDNVKCLGESSPYKPIGTYIFCSIYGAACIEDPQAILKMLILTFQNTEESGIVEENGIAAALISEHLSYGDKLRHAVESACSTMTADMDSESSIEMGVVLQLKAMGFQTPDTHALFTLKKAAELKTDQDMKFEKLNVELSKNQRRMAELEWYIKTVSKDNDTSYYDAVKQHDEKKDFHVNLERRRLRDFWDEIIDKSEYRQLPSNFRFQNKWINAGTAYRRLVEPLDIADYYRRQSNRGSYLSIENRPLRHRVLEKWLDDKNQTRIERYELVKRRTKFAFLTDDSCFWAHVEEAAKDLTNLQQERERHQTINVYYKKSLEYFEEYVSKMIEEKSISKEVFLEQSSFMIWWKKYREFELQDPEWKSSSPLLKFMENVKLGV